MSRYVIAKKAGMVPVQYTCPECHQTNIVGLGINGFSQQVIDARNSKKKAEENAEKNVQAQLINQVYDLYSMSQSELAKKVGDCCPFCKKEFAWKSTIAENEVNDAGKVTVFVLVASIIIILVWLIACIHSKKFTIEFFAAVVIIVLVNKFSFWYIGRMNKSEEKSMQEQAREEAIQSIPREYLPRLLLPKEEVLKKIQSQNDDESEKEKWVCVCGNSNANSLNYCPICRRTREEAEKSMM